MKKLAAAVLSVVMVTGILSGCGGNDASSGKEGFDETQDITVISREEGSGTRGAFIELFGIEEKDADGNKVDHTTQEAQVASKTDVVLASVKGNEYAIGYISLGSLNDSVKALKIDGAEPSVETIKDGAYKISRPFNIATKDTVSDAAQDFIDFILSQEGQKVAEDAGYIQAADNAAAFNSKKPSGKVVVAGSSSVTPVMEKLKEAYTAINGNVTIEVQQSDSSTGIQSAIDGTCDIGMASRELTDTEAGTLTPTVIALDGIAVITNSENPNDGLTKEQVKSIFTGETLTWELN